jgi:hypothetical protein
MAVPYIFNTMSASQGISLALLDADFAYLANQSQIKMEALTIATTNVVPALSETYSGSGMFMLIVNGAVFCPVGSPAPFSVSGTTVTWSSVIYTIYPGDSVVAIYSYS